MKLGLGGACVSIEDLVQRYGLIRPGDLTSRGISAAWLTMAQFLGVVSPVGPALYGTPSRVYCTTARAWARARRSVVSGPSALWVHGYLAQEPAVPWLAIPWGGRSSGRIGLAVRFVRLPRAVLQTDVETRRVCGVELRVFSLPLALAQCLRLKGTGSDVGPALVRALESGDCSLEALCSAARVSRSSTRLARWLDGRRSARPKL